MIIWRILGGRYGLYPLVSCMIIMMMWMNNIPAGGVKLFARGVGASVAALVLALLIIGFTPPLSTSERVVYACLPMLIAYPLAIGSIAYRLAIQLHKQKELLQRLSRTDGLTGLYSRHYWEGRVRDLLAKVCRHPQSLSLILLDVDHFKAVNDTYGHGVGDLVLQEIAQQLLRCTISLGVATWQEGFGDYAGWMRAADHQGRNATAVHGLRSNSEVEQSGIESS